MKKTLKKRIVFLMAMSVLLFFCACEQKWKSGHSESVISAGEKTLLPDIRKQRPEKQSAHTDTQPVQYFISKESNDSFRWLRDRIDLPQTLFGVAYLGYAKEVPEEDLETDDPAWLREVNQAMLQKYPFIAEINADHIIGCAGHLYCIVPVEEDASVSICRVQGGGKAKTGEAAETLYQSESGEPVLLFANPDSAAYEADMQVQITDNKGNRCEWYPSFDEKSHLIPCTAENGDILSFDFTEYGWMNAPAELETWLGDGWTGMTALGLSGSQSAGTGWLTQTTAWDTDSVATFYLWFYSEDETGGRVDLNWHYWDSEEWEEMWSGFWTMETVPDGPGYVTLSLSLVGGKNDGITDGPTHISDTYPLLLDPSGTNLVLGKGENGIALPFMAENKMVPCELMLIEEGLLSNDSAEYPDQRTSFELKAWQDDGWTGMRASGLGGDPETPGLGWKTETEAGEINPNSNFSLWFYSEDETGGRATLYWNQYDTYWKEIETWNGFWKIEIVQDGPSYVTLSLCLLSGKNYDVSNVPKYICETYPLLMSPSGMNLVLGKGENGIRLPFMSQDETAPYVLTLVE